MSHPCLLTSELVLIQGCHRQRVSWPIVTHQSLSAVKLLIRGTLPVSRSAELMGGFFNQQRNQNEDIKNLLVKHLIFQGQTPPE